MLVAPTIRVIFPPRPALDPRSIALAMHDAPRLVAVVPTLDEASSFDRCLESAQRECDAVVVTDGGSRDGTAERARALGARVVVGSAGRGGQLHRGALEAMRLGADVLVFLHADTVLAPGAGDAVRRAVADQVEGGAFHVLWRGRRRRHRLAERLVRLRTALTGCPLGDQAQWLRADVYRALGGFRDWPILEDLDLARRLKRRGATAVLEPPVTTSARRYEAQGVVRTVALNWLIWALFLAGVSPRRLARWYRRVR